MRYLAALLSRSNMPRAPFDQHPARRSLAARKKAFRRRLLFLEQLEDRRVFAAISWDGGGGNSNWHNALNWDTDTVPSALDNVAVTNATVNVSDNDVTVFGLNLLGGSLVGTTDITVTGLFDWAGGTLMGPGTVTIPASASLNLRGVSSGGGTTLSNTLDGMTLINAGTAWTSGINFGTLVARNGAVIDNTGVFDIQTDWDVVFDGVGAAPTFNNSGLLKKTSGNWPGTQISAVFNNSGTVEALADNLGFISFIQSVGTTRLSGGSISGTLNIQGGRLEGSGTIFGAVNSSGQLSPGFSPGLLDVQGNYTQNSDGAFQAEIGGYTAGTQYDRLNVIGSGAGFGLVTLGGALSLSVINGFAPVDGDLFTIIDNDSTDIVDGIFNGLPELTIFSIPSGNQFQISYNGFGTGNDVVVKAINRPPTVGDPLPTDPIAVNTTINMTANFTDPDFQDTHTAVWDWDDGSTSTGTISETNGAGSVAGSHVYSAAGVYSVKLTVTDNHNLAATSSSTYVVVYDPSAGFVTGNGRINSPAGAYTANPALSGRATFGFVSKYQNGNNVPTGNTDFQFKLANFNFKSTSYDWLVVSGAKARFRGVGTVNGAGSYSFELTAIDGQVNGGGGVDKFRIKIWQGNQGNGVVYDNNMGAADGADPTTTLDGGNIVIHKNAKPLMASVGGLLSTGVGSLTQETLNQTVDQAINYWRSKGIGQAAVSNLQQLHVEVADLPDTELGIASDTNYVWIDLDAAGYGWQLDSLGSTYPSVTGGMDLLSVVAHELGHQLGLEHSHDDSDVMAPTLDAGVRKMVGSFGQLVAFFGVSSVLPVSLPLDVIRPNALGTVRLPNEDVEENQARDELFARLDDSLAKQLVQSPTIASKSPYDEPQKPAAEAEDLLAEDLLEVISLDRLAIHG